MAYSVSGEFSDGGSWTASAPSNSGNRLVTVVADENPTKVSRSVTLTVHTATPGVAPCTVRLVQEASVFTYDFTLAATETMLAAKGGSSTITAHLVTYRNGSQIASEDVTPSLTGEADGFALEDDIVTADNRGTIVGLERSITVKGSYTTSVGDTVTADITISQEANKVESTTYSEPVVSFSYDDAPAGGGTIEPHLSYTQTPTQHFTSGATQDLSPITEGAEVTYSGEGVDPITGQLTIPSAGAEVSERKQVASSDVTVELNGKTVTASTEVYQEANEASTVTYGVPVVLVSCEDVPAGGGSVMSGTCTYTQTATQHYSSGATSELPAVTSGGDVVWSGGAIDIPSLEKTVQPRAIVGEQLVATVTVNGQVGSGSVDVYQQANSKRYSSLYQPSVTINDIAAAGGSEVVVIGEVRQIVRYTSEAKGEEIIKPKRIFYDLAANHVAGVSIDHDSGKVTWENNKSTSIRSAEIQCNVTGNDDKSVVAIGTTRQLAGAKIYENPVFVDYHYDTRDAAGGTLTPYLKVTQTYTWNGVTGSGETLTYTSQSPAAGPTFSYKITESATGLSIDDGTGIVTWAANEGAERSGVAQCTVLWNGKSASNTARVTQSADVIKSYSDITINTFTVADISAAGGTIESGTYTATQTVYYISGKTTPITSGFHASYSEAVTAPTRGIVEGDRQKVGTLTLTLTLNEKTATKEVDVYQQENAVVSTVKTVDISLASGAGSSSSNPIPASGGRIQYNASGNTRTTYTSGSYKDQGFTPKISGSADGFTVDQPSEKAWYITAANRGTVVGDIRSVVVTASEPGATSKSVTVYQAANAKTTVSYGTPSVSLSYPTIPASGSTVSPNCTFTQSQTQHYTSGATSALSDVTSGGTQTYVLTAATGFSMASATDGKVTGADRGTTEGDARSTTVEVTVTVNSQSGTATATVTQEENAVTNSNYNPHITTYGVPTVSIGDGITAAGGSATVTCSCSNTETYSTLYTSGSTTSNTRSVAGTATWKITTNGNSRFSAGSSTSNASGTKVSHSSMTTNATTDRVVVTATNSGDSTKTATAEKSVINEGTTVWGAWNITLTSNTYTIPASGGTATITRSASRTGSTSYTSGSSKNETGSGTPTLSISGTGFSLSGTTVTAEVNTGAERSCTVTATIN